MSFRHSVGTRFLIVIMVASFMYVAYATRRKLLEKKASLDEFVGRIMFAMLPSFCLLLALLIFAAVICSWFASKYRSFMASCLVLLLSILAVEACVAASGFVMSSHWDVYIESHVEKAALESTTRFHNDEVLQRLWNDVHQKVDCCGVGSGNQWQDGIPDSCPTATGWGSSTRRATTKSCVSFIMGEAKEVMRSVAIAALVLLAVHFICTVALYYWDKVIRESVEKSILEASQVITELSGPNLAPQSKHAESMFN